MLCPKISGNAVSPCSMSCPYLRIIVCNQNSTLTNYDNEDPASQVSVEVNSAHDLQLTTDNKNTKMSLEIT